jgi:integrase/recombinase XerD
VLAGYLHQMKSTTEHIGRLRLSEFMGLFRDRSSALVSPNTMRSYLLSVRVVCEFVGDKELNRYTVADLDRFKGEYLRRVKPSSVNVALRSVKAVFARAKEWGMIEENVLQRVKLVRVPQQSPQYLTRAEQLSLLASVDDAVLKLLFEFLFNTGLRIGEALALKWVDVDVSRKQISVVSSEGHVTKTRRNRVVPLNDNAMGALPERSGEYVFCRQGRPLNVSYASHRFKYYVRTAGLPESIHLHSSRHSFASNLAEKNVDLYVIGKLLGHSSPALTTALYAHVSTSRLHDVVDLLQ